MNSITLYSLIANKAISTDTRTITTGDVYVGLKGEQFDGNAYVQQAFDNGATLAIIDNPTYKINDKCIVVTNTYETLTTLAVLHRSTFTIPIIAIGGSNGKTTTKELITSVLSKKYVVHATKGNLNNDIGVPLTLLAMKTEAQIAVIEIGANHAHEHTELMKIVSPTHILVTNNGADHLEGFGSIEGVRKANKEIFDSAKIINAVAFVNKDIDELLEDSALLTRVLYPEYEIVTISGMYAEIIYNNKPIRSQLFGTFNVTNIIAAITIGNYFNIPLQESIASIENYQPDLKRSQIIQKDDYSIVVDCYNANPTSMELSLKDFFTATIPNSRIIIVGDMFEVGETEALEHKKVLELITEYKSQDDVILCVGPRFFLHKTDFSFNFFTTAIDAKKYFDTVPLKNKQLFLKGSRGIKLEQVVEKEISLQ